MAGKTGKFVIYGCYGYTGRLISLTAAALGMPAILAGRDAGKVRALAEETGLPGRTVSLDSPKALDQLLGHADCVLHCAGPFAVTARPMAEACLRTGTHYLDITGEVEVFEMLAGMDASARHAQVMLMPGAGFDVVPTDCVAANLKARLPDATHLDLVILSAGGGVSHGTAATMVRSLGEKSLVRRDGVLRPHAMGSPTIKFRLDNRTVRAAGIPWGDLATAWRTTGIPNITTGIALPRRMILILKLTNLFGWLLRRSWVRNWIQRKVDRRPAGPSKKEREAAKGGVWGRVRNAKGEERTQLREMPEGYTLTVLSSLKIVEKVLAGDLEAGFRTPAGCYGAALLDEVLTDPPEVHG